MNRIKFIIVAVLLGTSVAASAQYSQLGPKNEFMLKVEAGYAPFIGNYVYDNNGEPGYYGYYLSKFHHNANLNVIAGVNISQDWFVGGGLGFNYFHNLDQKLADPYMGFQAFADFDFRPIWQSIMGQDYQPTSIKWAPMVGGRLGGSIMMGSSETYGTTFTPMLEVYAGANWYYWYALNGMRNMERNWHSFYATVGVAYMQQTFFLPIRIGWRW